MFFLEDELYMLNERDWYCDGTFFLVKNVDYEQIYIISVLYSENNKTFTYPVAFSYMKDTKTETYNEIFDFLKEKFNAKYNHDLKPRCIRMDYKWAAIKSFREKFGRGIKIRLCTIHIQRNWLRKFQSEIGRVNYFRHKIFHKIWRLLNGVFYLPVNCLETVISYCRIEKLQLKPKT